MESEILHFFKIRLDEQLMTVWKRQPARPCLSPLPERYGEAGDVFSAIDRISDGSYGICPKCGKELPLHSLYSNPARSVCTGCTKTNIRDS